MNTNVPKDTMVRRDFRCFNKDCGETSHTTVIPGTNRSERHWTRQHTLATPDGGPICDNAALNETPIIPTKKARAVF
jgi:hypothetical protein